MFYKDKGTYFFIEEPSLKEAKKLRSCKIKRSKSYDGGYDK